MRFEELTLKIPGDEFRVRFHDRLTVIHGVGSLERSALADSIIGALAGAESPTELTYFDNQGRRICATGAEGRVSHRFGDDTFAPSVLGAVAPDADALRQLMVVRADELGYRTRAPRGDQPAELVEARALLGVLTRELQEALAHRQAVEAMREALYELETRIRHAHEEKGLRQYARVLVDIERAKGELEIARAGDVGIDDDLRLLTGADRLQGLLAEWRGTQTALTEVRSRFGDTLRLNSIQLAGALAIPEDAPSDLEVLARALDGLERERVNLSDRLTQLSASRLPEISDPAVPELARADQEELWEANAAVIAAARKLEDEQVALGGLGPGGKAPAIAQAIEDAHLDAVEAERDAEQLWRTGVLASAVGAVGAWALNGLLPLIGPVALAAGVTAAGWTLVRPRRQLAEARKREAGVLAKAGAATYLAFQMRRVEAVIDPEARQRLETAGLDHRMAMTRWRERAGEVDPAIAAALESEIRTYAKALSLMGPVAEEIEGLRSQLTNEVEPAAEHARRVLLDACTPFGITDPSQATDLVRERLELGRKARLQARLEEVEAEESTVCAQIDQELTALGFVDGVVEARIASFDRAVARAQERADARARARAPEQIEEELMRLEAEAMVLKRPEWANVTTADACEEPDVAALRAEQDDLAAEYRAARAALPDIDRIADRHNALERRVSALETEHGRRSGGHGPDGIAELQSALVKRLTAAAHAGPARECVPVLLDEAFLRVPADRKIELLDMLERLGEKVQLVYLTDDPAVGTWARERAAAEAITLLEPVGEPA